jgi:hypothetical protein
MRGISFDGSTLLLPSVDVHREVIFGAVQVHIKGLSRYENCEDPMT